MLRFLKNKILALIIESYIFTAVYENLELSNMISIDDTLMNMIIKNIIILMNNYNVIIRMSKMQNITLSYGL